MNKTQKDTDKKKTQGFWSKLLDKLDKNFEKKAKNSCCCQKKNDSEGPSCC